MICQAFNPPLLVLAQDFRWNDMLLWSSLLAGMVIFLGLVAALVRRWLNKQGEDDTLGNPTGFSLHELKQMRDSGQLSEDEYETAREKLIAGSRALLEDQGDNT